MLRTFTAGIARDSQPAGITAGPDGAVWFTEGAASRVGRITTDGRVTTFPLGADTTPTDIVAGPDGNLWFTETTAGRIGRITPAGVITEFSTAPIAFPASITAGPDGNLWFSAFQVLGFTGGVARMTPAGVVTQFPVPMAPKPQDMAAGADGALWYTTPAGIGRITTAGENSGWNIGTGISYLTRGPDGNMWFTQTSRNRIGRITPSGAVTFFGPGVMASRRGRHRFSAPLGITAGPDGLIWFTEHAGGRIGRVRADGTISEFPPAAEVTAVRLRDARTLTASVKCPASAALRCRGVVGVYAAKGTATSRPFSVRPGGVLPVRVRLAAGMTSRLRADGRLKVSTLVIPGGATGVGAVVGGPDAVLRLRGS